MAWPQRSSKTERVWLIYLAICKLSDEYRVFILSSTQLPRNAADIYRSAQTTRRISHNLHMSLTQHRLTWCLAGVLPIFAIRQLEHLQYVPHDLIDRTFTSIHMQCCL